MEKCPQVCLMYENMDEEEGGDRAPKTTWILSFRRLRAWRQTAPGCEHRGLCSAGV